MKVSFVHFGRENLGIEYLSAVLKKAGHETSLALDPGLFSREDNVFYIPSLEKRFSRRKQIIKQIQRLKPDLVAFSVYTGTYQWACDVARTIKETINVPIVFGGIHPTLVPEKVIENNFVDFVIVGEGEEALLDLVEELSSERSGDNIQNLWLKQNGNIIKNTLRKPIADLDQLPYPDKRIFEEFINYRDDYIILTSRGCAFNCSYCCESYMKKLYSGRFFRRRSVNSVIRELKFMKEKYRFRELMFNDSIFFTDKKWLRELLQNYKNEIHISFRCFGDIRFFDEEIADLLKRSGCYAIEFGLQTINENIRRNVLNRLETHKQCENAFRICDNFKLKYDIDHMFGLPGEQIDDFKQAAEFYSQLKYLNRIKCHNLTYFPNLPIIEIAHKNGILSQVDINNIKDGRRMDNFFHPLIEQDSNKRDLIRNFQVFYKILPLLPRRWVEVIIKNNLYRRFRSIPSIFVVLLQILAAFKGRDYRYSLYLRNYPLSIINVLKNKYIKQRFAKVS